MIRGLVIVLVNSVEIEDDRDSLARVVVMITAKEEPFGVVRIIVFVIELQIEIRLIDRIAQVSEIGAHHLRADDIDLVGPTQVDVARVGIAILLAPADHINIELGDDLVERNG